MYFLFRNTHSTSESFGLGAEAGSLQKNDWLKDRLLAISLEYLWLRTFCDGQLATVDDKSACGNGLWRYKATALVGDRSCARCYPVQMVNS